MNRGAPDFFRQPPYSEAMAGQAEDLFRDPHKWRTEKNAEGTPEYRAVNEMITLVRYLTLNGWQQRVLWPWLNLVRERVKLETDPGRLRMELGYVIGALEVDQIRSRSAADAICQRYGVDIYASQPRAVELDVEPKRDPEPEVVEEAF